MGGNAFVSHAAMVHTEELALVATETTVVKRAITKSLARTQATAAKKKKPAKKAAKKPKAKKAKKAKKPKKKKKKKKKKAKKKKKKRKKKKAKKVKYVGGKRKKGQHKSKAKIASAKKAAAAIFKPVTCSAALSKITGISGKATRGAITKAVWVYIKKKGLNKGRNVGKIEGIFGGGSMFKLAGAVAKHVK